MRDQGQVSTTYHDCHISFHYFHTSSCHMWLQINKVAYRAITCSSIKSNPNQRLPHLAYGVATGSCSVALIEVGVARGSGCRGCDVTNPKKPNQASESVAVTSSSPCGILPPSPISPRLRPMRRLTAISLPCDIKQCPTFRRSAYWLSSCLVPSYLEFQFYFCPIIPGRRIRAPHSGWFRLGVMQSTRAPNQHDLTRATQMMF